MKEKFHIKHIEIYIVLLVIMIGVAAVSITYGCSNLVKREEGYYDIVAKNVENVPGYSKGYNFKYYLDNSSASSEAESRLSDLYTNRLSKLVALLDENNSYDGYSSIHEINLHPNEEVTIDEMNYGLLLDAYNKSEQYDNYSIFAAPIYTFYESIGSLETAKERKEEDPLNNVTNKTFLNSLAGYINNKNHVDLAFLGDNKVKLTVSNEYVSFLKDNEYVTPYISFNILKSSYIISNLASYIKANGYVRGYFTSEEGIIYELSGAPDMSMLFHSLNGSSIDIAQINLSPTCVNSTFRRFPLMNGDTRYYSFVQEDEVIYRSPYVNIATGEENNVYLSTAIYGRDDDLVIKTLLNNEIVNTNSIEEIRSYLDASGNNNLMVMVKLNKADKTIYVTNSIYNYVEIARELGYSLTKF